MADEAENQEEIPAAPPPPPPFWRHTWALWSIAIGAIVLLAAVGHWQLVARPAALARLRDDIERAETDFRAGRYADALTSLDTVERRLWRAPRQAGRAYFLLGGTTFHLAEEETGIRQRDFFLESIAYLEEAQKRGIDNEMDLPLREMIGIAQARTQQAGKAIESLTDVLLERRRIAAAILRRQIQAKLTAPAADRSEIEPLMARWQSMADLPRSDLLLVRRATSLWQREQTAELAKLLLEAEKQWPSEDKMPALAELEATAEARLSIEGPAAALGYLAKAEQSNQEKLSQLLRWLSESYRAVGNITLAARYGEQWLALPHSDAEDRTEAEVRQAQLLLATGRPVEARRLLQHRPATRIPSGVLHYLLGQSYLDEAKRLREQSAEAWLESQPRWQRFFANLDRRLRAAPARSEARWLNRLGRWLADRIAPEEVKATVTSMAYLEASRFFRQVAEDRSLDDESYYGRALLGLGDCQHHLRQEKESLATLTAVIDGYPNSTFARAGRFWRAEVLCFQNDPAAIQAFRSATAIPNAEAAAPQLSAEEIHRLFGRCFRRYRERGQNDAAIEVARLFGPLIPVVDGKRRLGEAARARAEEFAARARREPTDMAQASLSLARAHFRLAGESFAAAADAGGADPEYAAILWDASNAYLLGQDYESALEQGNKYLEAHAGGPNDFSARILLARAEVGRGQPAKAKAILDDALARHPRSVQQFAARLLLAEIHIELARSAAAEAPPGQRPADYLAKAETNLRENTDGVGLDPASTEWRRSLFALGRLLVDEGRYDEASERLREFLRRYPESEQVPEAMYHLGLARWRSADAPRNQLAKESTPRGQSFYRDEMWRRLDQASDIFRALARRLASEQERGALNPDQQVLIRAAYFNLGDVRMEREDWEGAIAAYTTAASRFQTRPECLAAYVQIANAYWRTGRPLEAQSTLRQGRWVLSQLDPAAFRDSSLDKNQWDLRLAALLGGP